MSANNTIAKATTTNTPETKGKVTSQVLAQIEALQAKKQIQLPADYAPGNALTSAWLKLNEVQNLDKRPILTNGQLTGVVTLNSVVNALHDMAVQGLNPGKTQCYFIVYGDRLVMQRSYFGDMAIAKRIMPGIEFYYDVIREGEVFSTTKIMTSRGLITTISKHEQAFPNAGKIIGAYCGVVNSSTGENLGVDVMDIDRIKKSWGMSKTYKPTGDGTHNKFEAEMAIRTVIRHRCKAIFNSSDDAVLLASINRSDSDALEAEAADIISENANRETLSLPAAETKAETPVHDPKPVAVAMPVEQAIEPVVDAETGEVIDTDTPGMFEEDDEF